MSREDYIEVSERLQTFMKQYPEGSLQTEYEMLEVAGQPIVVVKAYAYRTPTDERPGIGHAWEMIPGRTPFTRGSELMNGETSAWGRAMAALGIAVHRGIATGNEIRSARESTSAKVERLKATPEDDPFYDKPKTPGDKQITPAQLKMLHSLLSKYPEADRRSILERVLAEGNYMLSESTKDLTLEAASFAITKLKAAATLEVDP